MRVLLCKFCEYVCKLENGRHTLVGVFDDVRSNAFPVDHPVFFLALQLEAESDEMGSPLDVVAKFVDPDNKEVFNSHIQGEVPTVPGADQFRMFFYTLITQRITFQKPGDYRIVITSRGDIIHIEHLPVFQVKAPAG